MKLAEIKDVLKKKLKRNDWEEYEFIEFDGICWRDQDHFIYQIHLDDLKNGDWEVYEKPKSKKRYWIWSICPDSNLPRWTKICEYLDENGFMTCGNKYSIHWPSYERIKHENEFIDV